MTIFRSRSARAVIVLGGCLMVLSLLSGIELEARVGTQDRYAVAAADRPDAIDLHGRRFFVGRSDWWRSNATVYVLVAGLLLIVVGRSLREKK